jgi:hypothetical protein
LWRIAQPNSKHLHQPFLNCTAQLKALVVVVLSNFSPQQLIKEKPQQLFPCRKQLLGSKLK